MKKITIIGGGISGLAVLHFLKQRFGDSLDITLYERDAQIGGTVRSFKGNTCLFEWGPNAFLDNQPLTLDLINDIGASDYLIASNTKAKQRYIQHQGHLYALPTGLWSFFKTPILSFKDKIILILGIFKNNISSDKSIEDYVTQRFSKKIAETLVDPFISGIYAGDIKRLHMASAFPKFKRRWFKRSKMRSFKGGMGQLTDILFNTYKKHIVTNSQVSANSFKSDITIVATPAYAAAKIVESLNPPLGRLLDQVPYAPIAVVGLLFKKNAFKQIPDGFGYLIPSKEKKEILGVLIETNVFLNRAEENNIMIRVMIGGAHHPAIINDAPQELIAKAIREIDETYGLLENPIENFLKQWPKAIPQYEINYPFLRQQITEQCAKTPGLYLCANYLDGISFNECIANARNLAYQLII